MVSMVSMASMDVDVFRQPAEGHRDLNVRQSKDHRDSEGVGWEREGPTPLGAGADATYA